MKDLLDIRKDIDKIDEQIVKLYEERMKLTSDVAEYKINTGKQVFDKERGAGIFVSVEDFLQELQLQPQNITTQIDFRKNLLEKDESLVYALLDFYPVGLGTLIEKSPYGLVEILPVLERLEQKGFIQETIPNYYIKTI